MGAPDAGAARGQAASSPGRGWARGPAHLQGQNSGPRCHKARFFEGPQTVTEQREQFCPLLKLALGGRPTQARQREAPRRPETQE